MIPLSATGLGAIAHKVFLASIDIDEADTPDERRLTSFHFALGFPASRKLFKIDHGNRRILQHSFQIQASPPEPGTYAQEGLSLTDHLLVEFDRERMMHKGQEHTAPDPRGVSGGGIFYIDKQTELGPLVAIATEHRSNSRLIVGTRIKHFLNAARVVNSERRDLLE